MIVNLRHVFLLSILLATAPTKAEESFWGRVLSPEQPDGAQIASPDGKAKMLSDVKKAEAITFAQANLRINMKNDTELEYALLHARNAKTSGDVQKVFTVVSNRSAVWDPDSMEFKRGPDPKVLQNRKVTKTSVLQDSLAPYSIKYLLAKNLFMVSFYHGNPVSMCPTVLDDYSPQKIVALAGEGMMRPATPIVDNFLPAMIDVNKECLGHSLDPDLSELRRELRTIAGSPGDRRPRLLLKGG
jgi:hypothetical protein